MFSSASTSSYDNVQKTSRPLENYTKPEKKSPRPLEEYVKRRKSETRLKSPPSSPPGPQQRPLNVKPTSPKTYSSPDATRRIEIKIAEKMKSDQDFQPVGFPQKTWNYRLFRWLNGHESTVDIEPLKWNNSVHVSTHSKLHIYHIT